MRLVRMLALGIAATLVLAACAKGSNSSNAESTGAAEATSAAATMAASSAAPMQAAAGSPGEKLYQANCSSCHQADGKGVAGSFPPLAGNPLVIGDPKVVIHAVKFGLTGKIVVQTQTFNGIMPPWSSQLSDAQTASVVTYIRSSWGNKAPAVSAAQVSAVTK